MDGKCLEYFEFSIVDIGWLNVGFWQFFHSYPMILPNSWNDLCTLWYKWYPISGYVLDQQHTQGTKTISLGGKTMEYWRKNCQNPVFYQLVSIMKKSEYSQLFPSVIYHGIIRLSQWSWWGKMAAQSFGDNWGSWENLDIPWYIIVGESVEYFDFSTVDTGW
jgi:hypothetical protein